MDLFKEKTIQTKNNGLTAKQERFCLEYAKTGNGCESLKRAGYSTKSVKSIEQYSHRLLKQPKIQNRIKELTKDYIDDSIADIKEIQKFLTDTIRQLKDEEIIVVEGQGEGISKAAIKKKKAALKDALKAAELLGKMQGAFTDNVNINGGIPVFIKEDIPEE